MTKDEILSSEDRALEMFWDMKQTFGWSGTFMMKSDVEWQVGRELTDDEWDTIKSSPYWHKVIPMSMAEGANEIMVDMLVSMGIDNDE